ncbi:MAG: transcription termination factor NusA [Candidatus Porifericomitaceae bacterium WSBS_2022_MAG_OTU9]
MNGEILKVVESVSNEKGVSKEIIFEAVESALAAAAKKNLDLEQKRKGILQSIQHDDVVESVDEEMDVRAHVDRDNGEYEVYQHWNVVEQVTNPKRELSLEDAKERDDSAAIGQVLVQKVEGMRIGRIFAQNVRQVIVQKVRVAERERVAEMYRGYVGQMLSGTVKRVDRGSRGGILVDLGNNAEGFIPRNELIPREVRRLGERVRCLLRGVDAESRWPQLHLCRTATELLVELFRVEVPEIGENLVEIVSAVRDPGHRARIAVRTSEARIDPIGACVGMRGSRVQAVTNELAGERVDIVQWDENPVQFVINAMVPAEIASVISYEDSRSMDIIVAEENLSQAIGRNGQNVKLASELCGWKLNVISVEDAERRTEEENAGTLELFRERLVVDAEVANILIQEGFSSIEEVAYVPEAELMAIAEFDEALVQDMRQRATDDILARALRTEVFMIGAKPPSADLLAVPGMDQELAWRLSSNGIVTASELAVMGIDDILDLDIEMMHELRAHELIMAAREPLLSNEEEEPDEVAGEQDA